MNGYVYHQFQLFILELKLKGSIQNQIMYRSLFNDTVSIEDVTSVEHMQR